MSTVIRPLHLPSVSALYVCPVCVFLAGFLPQVPMMLGRVLLRTLLLLCLSRLTLQKGTGYGAPPSHLTGNGAAANVYGAQAAGNGGKPNGSGKLFNKGFSPRAVLGNGAKANGNGGPPASALKGNGGGYGPKPSKPVYGGWPSYGGIGAGLGLPQVSAKQSGGFANGYGYRPPFFGGYRSGQAAYGHAGTGLGGRYANGAKPSKPAIPGYSAGTAAQKGQGAKPKGYGAGVSTLNAQGAKPKGFGPSAAATKGFQPGHGGYAKAGVPRVKAGYGGLPTGYGLRPNGYGAYPRGGAKASKAGFGVAAGTGSNTGAGANTKGYGYGSYGNEKGPKGPKGVSLGPESQRQPSLTPNTKGVSLGPETQRQPSLTPYTKGVSLGPETQRQPSLTPYTKGVSLGPESQRQPSLTPYTKGMNLGPETQRQPSLTPYTKGVSLGPETQRQPSLTPYTKGVSLGPETQRQPSLTPYTKGIVSPLEPESTGRVPPAAGPTAGVASLLTNGKAPKPQTWSAPLTQQGKMSEFAARESVPTIHQGKPVFSQGEGSKPAAPVLSNPQGQVPVPVALDAAGLVPTRPVQPAPYVPYVHQAKGPKQPAAAQTPVFLQGNPYIPAAVEVLPQSQLPQSQLPQPTMPVPPAGAPPSKSLKPVMSGPGLPQTLALPVPSEPVQTMAQLDGSKVAKPELAEAVQLNRQGTKSSKSDCAHGGVSGQWTKLPSPGYGPAVFRPHSAGTKASKPGYVNGDGPLPGPGYGYGDVQAGVAESFKGTSQIEPQPAELGPFGMPYGAQPMGLGLEGSPQVQYAGIGGLPFAGAPVGYNPDPYGKYGSPYGAQSYPSKPAGAYGGLFGSKPQGLGLPSKAAGKYGLGGVKYGGDVAPASTYGFGGLPYGASLGPDTGKTGKYGQPAVPYAPVSVGLGGDAKSSMKYGKYGNPALAFDALGPVTDGKSIDQPVLPYEPLAPAPQIDSVKSVDQFGQGKVPLPNNMGVGDGVGDGTVKSTDKYGTGGVRGIQAEVVSFPAAPLTGTSDPAEPSLAPAVYAISADGSSLAPATMPPATAGPPEPSPEVTRSLAPSLEEVPPSVTLQPATPEQIHTQHLQDHAHPQGQLLGTAWTGAKENKYNLKGFFGTGHQG
ncbi:calymmin isoform X3 [Brachyhypopomus gauderio]|uniref:calymmin isoform X3 n=1 Tax=Brachyhypopomus gauderio TaxID=698409 RepID=UPI00404301DD